MSKNIPSGEEIVEFDKNKKIMEDMMGDAAKENEVHFSEWNDEMVKWIEEYKEKIEEAYKDGTITVDEYENTLENIDRSRKRFIDEGYVSAMLDNLEQIDLSYLDNSQEVNKKSIKFDKYLEKTCKRNHTELSTFSTIIEKRIEMFCEEEKEIKAFKSILYELTCFTLVSRDHVSQFKFIYLFLNSMKEYGLPIFNGIAQRYIDYRN